MIRQISQQAKLTDEVLGAAMETFIPQASIEAVVEEMGVRERRQRKLPARVTMALIVAMNLFTYLPLHLVLGKLLWGLRLVWHGPALLTANQRAICQARYPLGARAMG